MNQTPVEIEVRDHTMIVTLNRPEAKNAVNGALAEGVAAAMDELDRNDQLRVGIITGAGGTFCSGMDLKAFVKGETPTVEGKGFGGLTERPPQKPLIAAVEGYALAGGFEIAITCDLIVAANNAKFGIPEAKLALVAGAGGLLRFPRQAPPRIAMEYALTGEHFDAQRAYEIGLINRLVEPGKALDTAMELASKISANGPLAITATKQILVQSAEWTSDEMWDRQQELMDPVFHSEDAIEGATAFAEKRAPVWKGR